MNIVDELHAVAAALDAHGVPYAVCGGLAVTIHGATRTTKDIDILIAPGDVVRAVDAVRPLGYAFVAQPMTFEEGTPRERLVQWVTKIAGHEHLMLDLMLADAALTGTLDDRLRVPLPSGTITVVSRETLIRMKQLAGRAQDAADLARLRENE